MSQTRTSTLSPGVRARLHDLGVHEGLIGRPYNNVAAPAPTANPAPVAELEDVVIPDSPAALEELLGDEKKMKAVLGQPDGLATVVNKYVKHVLNRQQDIQKQITEEVERVTAGWLRENADDGFTPVNLSPTSSPALGIGAGGTAYNPRAIGAKIDKEFTNSAEFLRSIWHNTRPDAQLQAKLNRVRNAFSSTEPGAGGFLIPETLRSEILSVALESAVVRSRARVIPMESLRVPIPSIDSTSNVSSVFGGIVAYWTEEGAALVESEASFGRVVLDAKKLTAYAEMPNELIADATALGSFFNQMFPQAVAFYEDVAFLSGTGVGEPFGSLHADNNARVTVAKEAGQPADTIYWENIIKMYARMLPASLATAVWVVSPNTFPELATMALSVGTGGSAIWLNNGVAGPPMTILGRPVIVSEKVAKLGDAGDVNFIDFGYYLIGDRQAMSAESSPHYKFANDKTAFRIIERVDGRPWIQSAITPKNGGDTLSPFVSLAERA